MKRYGLLLPFMIFLALVANSGALAVFPAPDASVTFHLNQGWFDGHEAWFISTDTTEVNLANQQRLRVFQALPTNAAPVYIVTNPIEPQGPVFSAAPDPVPQPNQPPYYSGIWRVIYVNWNTIANRVPLVSEQQITDLLSSQALSLVPTLDAIDYSIVAIGPLGDPDYLIPQAQDVSLARKEIVLPAWDIYSQDPTTGRVYARQVIIPDALSLPYPSPGYLDLARLVGANPAYGLAYAGPIDNNNTIAAINWTQMMPDGGFLPVPADQLLVSRASPTQSGTINGNWAYSPYTTFIVMARFPTIPPWVVFDNWAQIANSPDVTGVYGGKANAPIL